MDELLEGPRLEKRIMPLLDVALSLVGVLILMVWIGNEKPTSGIEGNVARIDVQTNGNVVFGESVLATTANGIDDVKMNRFFEELGKLKDPLVLMYFTRPSKQEQSVNAELIGKCLQFIESRNYKVRATGRNSTEGDHP